MTNLSFTMCGDYMTAWMRLSTMVDTPGNYYKCVEKTHRVRQENLWGTPLLLRWGWGYVCVEDEKGPRRGTNIKVTSLQSKVSPEGFRKVFRSPVVQGWKSTVPWGNRPTTFGTPRRVLFPKFMYFLWCSPMFFSVIITLHRLFYKNF